ncbi:hypothetical protein [Amycolatopsis thermoflava]|uniref:hypothetical protein n=1 Tax=Amycolatopsis thermoflava TaxID=84480 RepID=UPI000428AE8A|nr:hypothetical protein [Amycolatopsis thermoflava]
MPDVLEQLGFADLVCDDPDWLRDEFTAIIEANFGETSPPRSEPPRMPLPEPAGRPARAARTSQLWRRQRSPPRSGKPLVRDERRDDTRNIRDLFLSPAAPAAGRSTSQPSTMGTSSTAT